jgi:hypothetical protein
METILTIVTVLSHFMMLSQREVKVVEAEEMAVEGGEEVLW